MFTAQQRILVTGASSGIGRAIALRCNALGATVLASGRNADRLAEGRRQAVEPSRWVSIERDLLEDMETLPGWVRGLAREHGKLWGLAHAAGDGLMDSLRTYGLAEARRHFDLGFHMPVLLAQGFCYREEQLRGYPFGFGQPEDVAHMAAFLLSDQARWITGQNFVLAGGRY